MTARQDEKAGAVRGVLDADGHLIEADPLLADLHRSAGGRMGGMLAVPQVAALARLARRLGITISRAAIAADDQHDLELWVRAEPRGDQVSLEISGWKVVDTARPTRAALNSETALKRGEGTWEWQTDAGLHLGMLSGAAAATGADDADLVGKALTSLFRFRENDDGALPILLALAERRRFEDQLAELRTGTRALFRLSGVPLVDGSGRFAGFRGSAVPVIDAPSAGAAPAASLRAPLGEIVAQAESMQAAGDGALASTYAGYAGDIASAGRHLLSLVDDLGDLQAIEQDGFRTSVEPIDLAAVARQAATLLAVRAAERQVRLATPLDGIELPAAGDARRAFQILVNLIGNAIRYSPEGEAVEIKGGREGGTVSIAVTDRGKGIAPADQQRVFEKFERVDPSEPGGTGLGLYIARRLARAMGGDIDLVSAPGLGARFTLTLPERA